MAEIYVDDELPLPSFAEVFGDGLTSSHPSRGKNKNKRPGTGSNRVDNINGEETTGRWTPEEHRLFLEGIKLYGRDWKKMQALIRTRTLVQIRTHAQKVFKKFGGKKLDGSKEKSMAGARFKKSKGSVQDVDDEDDDDDLIDDNENDMSMDMSHDGNAAMVAAATAAVAEANGSGGHLNLIPQMSADKQLMGFQQQLFAQSLSAGQDLSSLSHHQQSQMNTSMEMMHHSQHQQQLMQSLFASQMHQQSELHQILQMQQLQGQQFMSSSQQGHASGIMGRGSSKDMGLGEDPNRMSTHHLDGHHNYFSDLSMGNSGPIAVHHGQYDDDDDDDEENDDYSQSQYMNHDFSDRVDNQQ